LKGHQSQHRDSGSKLSWRSAVVAIVALLAVAVALWFRPSSFARGPKPDFNVLVITLDTTRADALGAYGATNGATPNLDRLARGGVVFEDAVTAAPLTLPAHSSLFTAKYPPRHGVRDNGGFVLDPEETTLAERLKGAGFRTGGFVGAYVLDRRWGIAQGFETYFDNFDVAKAKGSALAAVERPANEVADHALAWLDSIGSSRFFAWVHFYDAHSPYDPPEPYRTRFADRLYEGEVAFVDSQVGRLVASLERRHLLDKTIVVAVGDHGESLGEHGESTHGFFVYRSVLHVPFTIVVPGGGTAGKRVASTVRTVDLTPTLLDLLGLPMGEAVDGRSLVPLMTGSARDLGLDAYSEAMYPRYHFGWSELRSLTSGRYHYIDAPRPELYDTQQDPAEAHNLYGNRQPLAERMAASLRGLEPQSPGASPRATEVDPEVRARLAALGYVGTFAATSAAPGSTLADPKDKIDLFNLMTDAREKLQDEQEAPQGIEMLQRVAAKDPQVVDAWLLLGNEFAKRGQYAKALAHFRRALELKPDYDLALRNMAHVYRDMGRPGDAITGYERLLSVDRNNVQARLEYAQLLLDLGRLPEADHELATVLQQEPNLAAAHNALGALRLKQGQREAGEREIRAALAQQSELRLAHFNLALAAELRGDFNDAIVEYRAEIEKYPDSYMAQFNLGKVYERLGDRESQLTAYEASIASNPHFAEGHFFLAKLYLDRHQLGRAVELAKRGLELAPESEWAPLGHFVLADAYAATGQRDRASSEALAGRQLAARTKR
jgi:arylsulfatase A-like enzyme/Tfp pilus assembly protein PilF